MITDPKELQRMVDFASIAKSQGFTPQQVDKALQEKGSSLQEVGSIIQYGPEKVSQMRQGRQQAIEKQQSTPEQIKKYAKIAGAGLEGFVTGVSRGAERDLNALSLGGYSWLNEKLGGNYEGRQAEQQQMAEEIGPRWGKANKVGNFLIDLGAQ